MSGQLLQFLRPTDVEGRVAPCDLDAEASVISACMIDAGSMAAVGRVNDLLKPDHFYSEPHRRIFEAILAVVAIGARPDMVTVGERLKVSERLSQVGGMSYLAEILDAAPAVINVVQYAQIVHDRWRERQIIATCQRVAASGYLGVQNTQGYADSAIESLATIARASLGREHETNLDALKRIVRAMVDRSSDPAAVSLGLSTGVDTWDNEIGGLHPGEVTTLVGRPGRGKTTLALQVALRTAAQGLGVLFFCQDMSRDDLLVNALCHLAQVDSRRWRHNELTPYDWQKLMPASEKLAKLPIAIDDTRDITAAQVRSRTMTHGDKLFRLTGVPLGLVVVDYVQQLKAAPEQANAAQHEVIANSAKACKSLARELDVAVLMLAQQKREPDAKFGGKRGQPSAPYRPEMSDIAGSSRIEAESDNIAFLIPRNGEDGDARELIFRKVRRGQPFCSDLACDLGSGRMFDA